MNRAKSRPSQILLLMLLSIVLIVLDGRLHVLNGLHTVGDRVAMPLRLMAAWPGELFNNVTDYFFDKRQLMQQNTALQQQLLATRVQLQQLTQLTMANQQLKAALHLIESSQLPLQMTTVLNAQGYPYLQRLFIHHQQAVDVGSAVLVPAGVVGQVISTTPLVDTVLPVVDVGSAVPVQTPDQSVRAIAQGDGKNGLFIQHVAKSSVLTVGEQWVTSGLGGVYPVGYPVGQVVAIVPSEDHLFLTVILKPAVNFMALDNVAVVKHA